MLAGRRAIGLVRITGDDLMQALDRTFGFLADLINGHIEDGVDMWWQYEGDACGFRRKP
jgi:hypothetical protein